MARLKVFSAPIGFFDTVLAAPSQKAALAVWGTSQNLFHDGSARLAEDPPAIAAALAQPGVLLRRPIGSGKPFSASPEPPAAPANGESARTGSRRRPARRPKKKPAPDRRVIEELASALKRLDADHARDRRDMTGQVAALKARLAALDRRYGREAASLRRALAAARRGASPDAD